MKNKYQISVIILTYNSEATIKKTVESALQISDDVHIVDSYSSDSTINILSQYKFNVVQHEFENYSSQRNWAINNLQIKYEWQLHLDADERLSEELIKEIYNLENLVESNVDGYYIPRLVYFMGKPIRHGGMFPIWHLRLFKSGLGVCESRLYDQHFYVNGKTKKLKYWMIDDQRMSISEWVSRHNRWADAEAAELTLPSGKDVIQGKIFGNPVEKKRSVKKYYEKMPLFIRPFLFFIYRYFLKLGFLDGKEGLIFYVLQTFWFRFLVDVKIYELTNDIKENEKDF